MTRHLPLSITLAFALGATAAAASDPVSLAQGCFARGEYAAGLDLLQAVRSDPGRGETERARALLATARFYEQQVGNYEMARALYREILGGGLSSKDPLRKRAAAGEQAQQKLRDTFSEQDRLLDELQNIVRFDDRSGSASLEQTRREQVAALQQLVRLHPDYYRLAEACYSLGKMQFELTQYDDAARWLRQAKKLKPGIDLLVPVSELLGKVQRKRYRHVLGTAARAVLWSLLILAAVLFYSSRPWRWVTPRLLIGGAALLGLWALVFFSASFLLAAGYRASHYVADRLHSPFPSLIRAMPGYPGSEILTTWFFYTSAGILGVLTLTAGSRVIRRAGARIAFNGIAACLLISTLSVEFILRPDVQSAVFISGRDDPGVCGWGTFYFRHRNPQPYILTAPRRFSGIEHNVLDDPYWQSTDPAREAFADWVKTHCSGSVNAGKAAADE